MAETKVKQNQLDMTQIADASLSNLSDSAPVGLTNALTPLSKTVGYTVKGSPTIADGIVSNFGLYSYLELNTKLNGSTATKIEFYTRCKTPATFATAGWNILCLGAGDTDITPSGVYNESGLHYFGVFGIDMNQYAVTADTWYRLKFVRENGTSTAYLYDDNGVQVATSSGTDNFNFNATITLGGYFVDDAHSFGSIDLNNTYIKIDGEYWFVGRWPEISPAHLAAMSNTATKLTLVNEDIYTAPADGAFYIWGKGGGTGGGWLCVANNNETPSTGSIVAFDAGNGDLFTVYLPVKKGDKVRASLFGTASFDTANFSGMGFYFRYMVGNEFEAN